jgi:hypothetical protein
MEKNNTVQTVPSDNHYSDDEIDLRQICQKIWHIRWKVILFSTLFFTLGALFISINYYKNQKTTTLSYVVHLDKIINSRYPDGTQFNLSHLTLPIIFTQTKKELNLTDLDYKKFSAALQITYYNPNITLLKERFDELAREKKNKNPQSIQALQQALNDQQNQKSSIRLILTNSLGLTTNQQETLLLSLVKNWSDYFVADGVISHLKIESLPPYIVENSPTAYFNIVSFREYMLEVKDILKTLIQTNKEQKKFENTNNLLRLQNRINSLEKNYLITLHQLFNINEKKTKKLLQNKLLIEEKKEILIGLKKSLQDIQTTLLKNHTPLPLSINSDHNKTSSLPVFDIIAVGKKIGFSEIYEKLLKQKLDLEREIAQLRNDEDNLSNHFSVYLNSQRKPSTIKIKQYVAFTQQFISISEQINQLAKEYTAHFTNPKTQTLYSQSYQPTHLKNTFSLKKQLVIVLAISLFLSLITTIILLLRQPKK